MSQGTCPPDSSKGDETILTYRTIDLKTYSRYEHFERFLAMENPMVTITASVDISEWYHGLKKTNCPFFLSFQYAVAQAANRVPEFRQRIQGDGIIEYAFCNPSYTVAMPDGTYRFCLVNADQPFADYLKEGEEKQHAVLLESHLKEEGDVQSLLFTTCVPWLSYSTVSFPWPDPHFSIPNIGWGRYVKEKKVYLQDGKLAERELITIPVTVMVNHALVDGIHLARFFANLDAQLNDFTWP